MQIIGEKYKYIKKGDKIKKKKERTIQLQKGSIIKFAF